MKPIKATEIIIDENRQRLEFNPQALAELSQSIQRLGLLHPIVLRQSESGFHLVAGERRLRAMQMLLELEIPIICDSTAYLDGTVPYTLLSDLSPDDAFEAELEENIQRVDLSWQERANAVARLHALRSKQNEGVKKQTLAATAEEILRATPTSNDIAIISEDILVAKYLGDADVAKAPTKKEAIKVIERKKKVEHRALLAETFDLSRSKHTLIKGDFFNVSGQIADASVNCVLTDPPYGVDASAFGSNFSVTHNYEDGLDYFLDISRALASETYRVLKDGSHAYVFCSFDGFDILAEDFDSCGFRVWPQPLIWSKGNGNAPWVEFGFKRTYECIMFASKGKREMNAVKNDVLIYSPVANREHGAEKPVELLADLLSRSTHPGDKVLDFFAGSGSIFPAADIASCSAIGIERNEDSFNLALTKLELSI